MIFIILEMYCEAVWQDTTSEHLNSKLQLSKFILPLRGVPYMVTVGIPAPSLHLLQREHSLCTNSLSHRTVYKVHKWIHSKFHPIAFTVPLV